METVKTVLSIAAEAEAVFNSITWAKALTERAGGKHTLFTHVESLASSAVGCAERVAASLIIVFTQTGRAARLVAKYKPAVPILCVVVPRLCTDKLTWKFTGMAQARQSLIVRGLIPILADPKDSFASLHEGSGDRSVDGSMLASALSHAATQGLISAGERVVALQRLGGSAVVKILDVRCVVLRCAALLSAPAHPCSCAAAGGSRAAALRTLVLESVDSHAPAFPFSFAPERIIARSTSAGGSGWRTWRPRTRSGWARRIATRSTFSAGCTSSRRSRRAARTRRGARPGAQQPAQPTAAGREAQRPGTPRGGLCRTRCPSAPTPVPLLHPALRFVPLLPPSLTTRFATHHHHPPVAPVQGERQRGPVRVQRRGRPRGPSRTQLRRGQAAVCRALRGAVGEWKVMGVQVVVLPSRGGRRSEHHHGSAAGGASRRR